MSWLIEEWVDTLRKITSWLMVKLIHYEKELINNRDVDTLVKGVY